MNRNRIAKAWEGYRLLVIPANASEVQVIECRRAFYGGAVSLFGAVLSGLTPEQEVTEDDLQVMFDIQEEIKAYVAEYNLDLPPSGKPS